MCVAGLYFVFLLLEDVIVAYYSTDAASQDQTVNTKIAYDTMRKNRAKSLEKIHSRHSYRKREIHNIYNASTTPGILHKKWQVERVTRKQYEVINMLWRKTKIFMDEDNIYTTHPSRTRNVTKIMSRRSQKDPIKISTVLSLQTTTPSNIEFYYFDDTQDHDKENVATKPNNELNLNKPNNPKKTSKPSFFVFHIKGPYAKLQLDKSNKLLSNHPRLVNELTKMTGIRPPKAIEEKLHATMTQSSPVLNMKNALNKVTTDHKCTENSHLLHGEQLNNNPLPFSNGISGNTKPTTIYDKIKFFEQYDQNTPLPNVEHVNLQDKSQLDYKNDNKTTNSNKILLEHVDQGSHDHNLAKHCKKHIAEHFRKIEKNNNDKNNEENTKSNSHILNDILEKQPIDHNVLPNKNVTKPMTNGYNNGFTYVYENASWSEYPFTAVYIYEPSQVHCDAAGISAYWLVASGSCLSRVQMNGDGRSAYVAYCGDQWWRPDRVAYVKYSQVHPLYHSRDKTRRHRYNIGVIQVATSMSSACSVWAPVSLMSHQFPADSQSSWASAVGWGVDRFDTRYGATDLPQTPLMVYKGLVYFDSCPGNIEYSKAKRLDEGGGVRNVHCLALPPYSGEQNDPVHGGLLLVGGKLIALYLQEERRPWGDQSAQYTGVWRLIPWIMEVAREPDEKDAFIFEI